jgi:hypothetical protein
VVEYEIGTGRDAKLAPEAVVATALRARLSPVELGPLTHHIMLNGALVAMPMEFPSVKNSTCLIASFVSLIRVLILIASVVPKCDRAGGQVFRLEVSGRPTRREALPTRKGS